MPILLQVYSAPKSAGGYALGPVATIAAGRVQEAIKGTQGVTLTLARDIATASNVAEGTWLRLQHPRRGLSEWLVTTIDDADGIGRDTVTITAGPLRNLLALRGTVRTINTVGVATNAFTPGSQRPDTLLTRYFAPNLAADGLDFIVVGNSEYTDAVDVGALNQITRGELLDKIERATGYEFDFVPLADDAGYRLDLVRQRGLQDAVPLLQVGRQLSSVRRTRDLLAGATVIEPRSTSDAPMGEVSFAVTSIGTLSGGAYWVGMADPDPDRPAVIREDDQYVGLYLVPLDGLPRVILDSRISPTPAVQVADIAGLSIGTLVTLWSTAAGALPCDVSSPSGLLSSRGRVVAKTQVSVATTARNYAVDPVLTNGLSAWTRAGASTAIAVHDRADPPDISGTTTAAVLSAATSIPVTGFPANTLVRNGDALFVAGVNAVTTTDTVVSATGTATLAIVGTLGTAIAGDTTLTWTRGGVLIGTAVTDGAQSDVATSLALKSLPATVALVVGDTFTVSYSVTAYVYFQNITGSGGSYTGETPGLDRDIPGGTTFRVVESQVQISVEGVFTRRTIEYDATTVGLTPAGNSTMTFTASRDESGAWGFDGAGGTYTDTGAGSDTYTLTSAPAWSTARTASPTITGTTARALDPAVHVFVWKRGSTVLGNITLSAAIAAGASSLALYGGTNVSIVPASDTFTLPSFVTYSGANTLLNGSGAGTLTTAAGVPAAIGSGVAVRVRRCPDFQSSEIGSNVVLRLRGDWAGGALTSADYLVRGIFSPAVRVPLPAGSTSVEVRASVGLTSWAAEASQTYRLTIALFDADTGALITNQGGGSTAHAYGTTLESYTHSTLSTAAAAAVLTRTTRVRAALVFGGGIVGNNLGGFLFARWLSIGIGSALPPVVVGAGSQPLCHRALDLLEQRGSTSRYRVQLSAVTPYADNVDELLVVGGDARLRSTALGLDVTVRVQRIDYSLVDENDITLELAVQTPRFTDDGLTEALNG